MIHKSTTTATIIKPAEKEIIIPRVNAEVVSAPKQIQTQQSLRSVRTRGYSRKTVFEGNGKALPWEGQGVDVSAARSAFEVCEMSGLNFQVLMDNVFTEDGLQIHGRKATRRYDVAEDGTMIPSTVYEVVSDQYVPIQNWVGFEFFNELFKYDGFVIETAGQFDNGRIVWVEARIPDRWICGENMAPYIVFTNRHDGKGSLKIFFTCVRVVCKNTLNYAIRDAQGRSFIVRHTASGEFKLETAKQTMQRYNLYLDAMEGAIEHQKRVLLTDTQLNNMFETLLQFKETDSDRVKERVRANREELKRYYYDAPDLDGYGNSGFRFVNAVSDWATHRKPSRQTQNYRANLMQSTLEGNEYIDRAYSMVEEMDETMSIAVA